MERPLPSERPSPPPFLSNSQMAHSILLAFKTDTHSIEADFSALDCDGEPLEGLFQCHVAVGFDLDLVARLN